MPENKSPYLVDWAIISRCNLNCKHCRGFPAEGLSTERAKSLISEIAELKPGWVIVEGGEPLLRKDIFELLGLMQQKHLEVHFITNGMLLTREAIGTLKELGAKVMISIDGATASTYESIRNGASFDRVIKAARDCAREGLLEAINTTILKTNYTEIPGIFKLAQLIGVPRVTFLGLKPCVDYREKLLSPQQYQEAIRLTCKGAQETGIEFFFDEPFFWATVKEQGLMARTPGEETGILVSSTPACIFGEYMFIDTDGSVKPCSFSPIAVGDVNEKSLVDIWRDILSSPFLSQVREPTTRSGYCHSCRYLSECKGCRSRTYVLTGDWFAADPVCPLNVKEKVVEEVR